MLFRRLLNDTSYTPFLNCFTMRRINLLSGIFWCLIFSLSCTRQDSNPPVVHFISPELNSFHDLKTDLIVEIDISDDKMIVEYQFWLESDSGFKYFYDKKIVNRHSHKVLYKIDLSENISSDISMHVEVIDNDGNKTHDSIKISTL